MRKTFTPLLQGKVSHVGSNEMLFSRIMHKTEQFKILKSKIESKIYKMNARENKTDFTDLISDKEVKANNKWNQDIL